jgi:hypothetical protein
MKSSSLDPPIQFSQTWFSTMLGSFHVHLKFSDWVVLENILEVYNISTHIKVIYPIGAPLDIPPPSLILSNLILYYGWRLSCIFWLRDFWEDFSRYIRMKNGFPYCDLTLPTSHNFMKFYSALQQKAPK